MKKIFLEDLKQSENGRVNWKDSVGCEVRFIYKDVEDIIAIVNMTEDKKLILKYNDTIFYNKPISCENFKSCAISYYLGKRTGDFKVPLGKYICEDDRDLTILETEINNEVKGCKKYYKYKCNKCKNEDWMAEGNLIGGKGCNACCVPPRKTVLGINTIWDTDRWMCDLGVSEEDAKGNTHGSNKKIEVICPDCGKEKEITISNIYNYKSICCTCGDGFSYPCKFMTNVLMQLGVKFENEYSPDYLVRIENGKKSRKFSDFYLPEYNLVIETDGILGHKGGKTHGYSNRELNEQIEVDNWKDEQHRLKGVETIRINCFKSDMEYIKNSILNSGLNDLFDLSCIDWSNTELYAIKNNKVREVCNYWKNKEECETTTDVGNALNLSRSVILKYLKRGAKLKWCEYCPEDEKIKSIKKHNKSGKRIEAFKDGVSLGIFPTAMEMSRTIFKTLGIKLGSGAISRVCRGDKPQYKGFTFKYTQSEQQS